MRMINATTCTMCDVRVSHTSHYISDLLVFVGVYVVSVSRSEHIVRIQRRERILKETLKGDLQC
jgi:hypothetical protein